MAAHSSRIDWFLFGAITFLAVASLTSLASIEMSFFWRQLLWFVVAFAIFFLISRSDWRWVSSQRWFSFFLYYSCVGLLIFSHFQSETVRGTKSWITIAGIQFEPVEFMKFALILVLANFFSRRHLAAWQGKNIFLSFIYMAVPVGLVAVHPDLGSAFVIFTIWVGFLLMSGIHIPRLLLGFGAGLLCFFLLWTLVLKPYQKNRILAFVSPERDPLGINYNVTQSKIAIGSAGFFGKGFHGGTQTHLNFLPVPESDFIFAAFVEEWGFVGGALLIFSYMVILWRFVEIGMRADDNFSKFVVLGATILFLTHLLVNVGSNMGLVPVTGITLPFLSYGGSSLLTVSVLVGIIHSKKLESSI